MLSLVYRIEKEGEWETVFLSGRINEDAAIPLNGLLDKIGSKCKLNFKDVIEINSLGVRVWIHFIRIFEKTRSVILEECTPEVINQINMIPNFKGKSSINSLYARYICGKCGNNHLELFAAGKNMPKNSTHLNLPILECSQCGSKMEMEDFEEEFFACLQ